MEVCKDVYMMYGCSYANIANIFFARGPEGLLMFDTADSEIDFQVISKNLTYWGLDSLPITHVFLSHKHFNHIGNAHLYQDMGALIVAGEADADAIETGEYDQINDSAPFPAWRYTPCRVNVRVKEGDVVHAAGLEVLCISAPGHTNGSMFYQLQIHGKTLLFTGDVLSVRPDCSGAKLGWEGGPEVDRKAYLQTVRKVSKLHADMLLPGHFQLGLANVDGILRSTMNEAFCAWRSPMMTE